VCAQIRVQHDLALLCRHGSRRDEASRQWQRRIDMHDCLGHYVLNRPWRAALSRGGRDCSRRRLSAHVTEIQASQRRLAEAEERISKAAEHCPAENAATRKSS
jgi:hypothetical protein